MAAAAFVVVCQCFHFIAVKLRIIVQICDLKYIYNIVQRFIYCTLSVYNNNVENQRSKQFITRVCERVLAKPVS